MSYPFEDDKYAILPEDDFIVYDSDFPGPSREECNRCLGVNGTHLQVCPALWPIKA